MKKYISILISILFTYGQVFGFFDQNTQWEIRNTATANNRNGGTFILGASGTDYSQQNDAQYTIGGITSAGAGNVLLSTSAATDWVGNGFFSIGGTNMFSRPSLWQITAVTPGVDFTVQSTGTVGFQISTGVVADGRIRIGGALSLNSQFPNFSDDDVFEAVFASNTVWIKSGEYSLPASLAQTAIHCTASTPCWVRGYDQTRGDLGNFYVSTRAPAINMAAFTFAFQNNFNIENIYFRGTSTNFVSVSGTNLVRNLKVANLSNTAIRNALSLNTNSQVRNSEAISINGTAMNLGNNNGIYIDGCYVHDSNIGLSYSAGFHFVTNSVFASNRSGSIANATAVPGSVASYNKNNTFYGFKNLSVSTLCVISVSSGYMVLDNSIFANGFSAISKTGPNIRINYNENNLYYGFKSTFSGNYVPDINKSSFTINPQFVDDTELYGTTAAISGSVLEMHGGGMFANAGITDNFDYLHCHWGTGATAGGYLIIGHSSYSVTLNNAIGTNTTQDKVWTIRTGKNFNIGTGPKGLGEPYRIIGSSSVSYIDLGAVQRQESTQTSGAGGFFIQ